MSRREITLKVTMVPPPFSDGDKESLVGFYRPTDKAPEPDEEWYAEQWAIVCLSFPGVIQVEVVETKGF